MIIVVLNIKEQRQNTIETKQLKEQKGKQVIRYLSNIYLTNKKLLFNEKCTINIATDLIYNNKYLHKKNNESNTIFSKKAADSISTTIATTTTGNFKSQCINNYTADFT